MLLNYALLNQNQEKIDKFLEDKKNKKLSIALSNIIGVDSGNLMISTKHTDRFETITMQSVVFYNSALLKDVGDSYKELERAIYEIRNSELVELLSSEPTLLGKPVFFVDIKNKACVEIFEQPVYDYIRGELADVVSISDDGINFKTSTYFYQKAKVDELNILHREPLSAEMAEYGIHGKKSGVMETKSTKLRLIVDGVVNYGERGRRSSVKAKDSTITSATRVDYAKAYFNGQLSTTLEDYIKLTKSMEMLTYGEIKGSSRYSPSKSSRYLYQNPVFNDSVKNGFVVYNTMLKNYSDFMKILQNSFSSGLTSEQALSLLKKNVLNLHSNTLFERGTIENIPENSTYEQIAGLIGIGYKVFFEAARGAVNLKFSDTEQIGHSELLHDKNAELLSISNYFDALRLKDEAYELFKKSNAQDIKFEDTGVDAQLLETLAKKYFSRLRARLQDVKVDSFVINFRENAGSFLNEKAQKLYDESQSFVELVESLKGNKYHDYFELDSDFIKNTDLPTIQRFFNAVNELEFPTFEKTIFKARKTGNFKASGIYFPSDKMICVDFRNTSTFLSTYKHEAIHHVDISAYLGKTGRKDMVNALYNYFEPRIKDRAEYFLKDVELIARAGEIGYFLNMTNFHELKKQFFSGSIDTDEFVQKMKENFDGHKHSEFMRDFDMYFDGIIYVNVRQSILKSDFSLLEDISNYFRPFYSSLETNIEALKETRSIGYEDRAVDGLSPRSFTSYSYNSKTPLEQNVFTSIPLDLSALSSDIKPFAVEDFKISENVTLENFLKLKELYLLSNENIIEINPLDSFVESEIFEYLKSQSGYHNYQLFKKAVDVLTDTTIDSEEVFVKLNKVLHNANSLNREFSIEETIGIHTNMSTAAKREIIDESECFSMLSRFEQSSNVLALYKSKAFDEATKVRFTEYTMSKIGEGSSEEEKKKAFYILNNILCASSKEVMSDIISKHSLETFFDISESKILMIYDRRDDVLYEAYEGKEKERQKQTFNYMLNLISASQKVGVDSVRAAKFALCGFSDSPLGINGFSEYINIAERQLEKILAGEEGKKLSSAGLFGYFKINDSTTDLLKKYINFISSDEIRRDRIGCVLINEAMNSILLKGNAADFNKLIAFVKENSAEKYIQSSKIYTLLSDFGVIKDGSTRYDSETIENLRFSPMHILDMGMDEFKNNINQVRKTPLAVKTIINSLATKKQEEKLSIFLESISDYDRTPNLVAIHSLASLEASGARFDGIDKAKASLLQHVHKYNTRFYSSFSDDKEMVREYNTAGISPAELFDLYVREYRLRDDKQVLASLKQGLPQKYCQEGGEYVSTLSAPIVEYAEQIKYRLFISNILTFEDLNSLKPKQKISKEVVDTVSGLWESFTHSSLFNLKAANIAQIKDETQASAVFAQCAKEAQQLSAALQNKQLSKILSNNVEELRQKLLKIKTLYVSNINTDDGLSAFSKPNTSAFHKELAALSLSSAIAGSGASTDKEKQFGEMFFNKMLYLSAKRHKLNNAGAFVDDDSLHTVLAKTEDEITSGLNILSKVSFDKFQDEPIYMRRDLEDEFKKGNLHIDIESGKNIESRVVSVYQKAI